MTRANRATFGRSVFGSAVGTVRTGVGPVRFPVATMCIILTFAVFCSSCQSVSPLEMKADLTFRGEELLLKPGLRIVNTGPEEERVLTRVGLRSFGGLGIRGDPISLTFGAGGDRSVGGKGTKRESGGESMYSTVGPGDQVCLDLGNNTLDMFVKKRKGVVYFQFHYLLSGSSDELLRTSSRRISSQLIRADLDRKAVAEVPARIDRTRDELRHRDLSEAEAISVVTEAIGLYVEERRIIADYLGESISEELPGPLYLNVSKSITDYEEEDGYRLASTREESRVDLSANKKIIEACERLGLTVSRSELARFPQLSVNLDLGSARSIQVSVMRSGASGLGKEFAYGVVDGKVVLEVKPGDIIY